MLFGQILEHKIEFQSESTQNFYQIEKHAYYMSEKIYE